MLWFLRMLPFLQRRKKCTKKSADDQSSVKIMVCEGERKRASDNNLLGLFYLDWNLSNPRGHSLNVYFDIDADGILIVYAEEECTGNKKEITITNNTRILSTEQIMRMIQKAEKYKAGDEEFQKKVNAVNALDDYVYKINKALKDIDRRAKLRPEEEMKFNWKISKGKKYT